MTHLSNTATQSHREDGSQPQRQDNSQFQEDDDSHMSDIMSLMMIVFRFIYSTYSVI